MSEKIKDSELVQYLSGELSDHDAERIKTASERDPEIASKILKMKKFDKVFEEQAKIQYPIPNDFLNEIKGEMNLSSSNVKNNVNNESFIDKISSVISSTSPFRLVSISTISGATATFLFMFLLGPSLFLYDYTSTLDEIKMTGTRGVDIADYDGETKRLQTIFENFGQNGWNIHTPVLAFRVEVVKDDGTKETLINGSDVKVGQDFIITILSFSENEIALKSSNNKDVKYFKIQTGELREVKAKIAPPIGKDYFTIIEKSSESNRAIEFQFNIIE